MADKRTRPAPKAIDVHHDTGLRTVAVFEAVKGLLMLAVGFGLLHLIHKDVGEAAEHLVHRLHVNPERHFSQVFLEAAYKMTDAKLWAFAAGGLAYSTVRFVEAYGLWHRRVWAEWFALLSGCLYLPWEIYEVLDHATHFRWVVLLLNLAIVLYMARIRWTESHLA